MATSASSYPKIGVSAWRIIRAKAVTSPSYKFSPTAVAVLLGHESAASATLNVVSPMQRLGLLDEQGNLTERGHKWRGDDSYAEACQDILNEVYPADLAGFTTASGSPDRTMVKKWFLQQKFGESNARQMAATYVMIAEKKLPEPGDKQPKPKAKAPSTGTKAKASTSTRKPATPSVQEDTTVTPPPPPETPAPKVRPDVHLDFQIHIDADAKPEVIDQIFASMAKHLYPTT
jgi:hypothetical protein